MPSLPWNQIEEFDTIPDGFYAVNVDEATLTTSSTGKLMAKVTFRLTKDNPDSSGRLHFENYVLGTDDDLMPYDTLDPKVIGVKNLIRLFKALNMPPPDDLEAGLAECVDLSCEVRLSVKTQVGGDYDGRMQNRINQYFPTGSKTLGPVGTQARNAQSTNRAVPRRTVQDDDASLLTRD